MWSRKMCPQNATLELICGFQLIKLTLFENCERSIIDSILYSQLLESIGFN